MQVSEYKILQVLAEEMNMRKAAERLYISQPALSQRLQTIERQWGMTIFIRSQKGLTLTPAGEKIIDYVNETLKQKERVKDEIMSMHSEVHGTLKLAVASIIGQYWLPQVLKEYVHRYPHVKISLVTGWSSEMLRHLHDDHFHLGMIRGNPEWKGKKEHLFSDSLYLVDTEITSVDQLQSTTKPFIMFRSDSTYFQEIQKWWREQFATKPKRTIVVDQIETCKQMAYHGIGYAILPSITLLHQSELLHKIPITLNNRPVTRDTWLLSYEAATELKHVRAFIDLVDEYIQQQPFAF
ncbi:LysR family transcriptional regulator [Massilibacterium senegalense]|uniref:LysR family transcriptional regulator n=1 Tax=Massilibacterium senegalense TaxID=1632858 RepID=UPI000783F819|nr:LysR family transcriptional regulator [Massilibacterium senegalense]